MRRRCPAILRDLCKLLILQSVMDVAVWQGVDRDIEEARQTLAQFEVDIWGIALREIEGERFVVLPAGSLAYPPWTVRDRPAVKL